MNVSSSNVFESTAVEIAPTQEALYSSYYYATTAAFASVAYALDQGEHRCRSRERWPCCPSSNLRTKLTPCTTDIQGAPASFAIFQRIHACFKCGLFLQFPSPGSLLGDTLYKGMLQPPPLSSCWSPPHLSLQTLHSPCCPYSTMVSKLVWVKKLPRCALSLQC